MSPIGMISGWVSSGFPRVSGDEPKETPLTSIARKFSPRERG